MNIYEKINEARIMLQDLQIKKSGKNAFSKQNYFELSDIVPPLNAICKELGLNNLISFGIDIATMTITDTENSDQVSVTSPMSTAALKGCHEVQNLGAVETYLRRYLYQIAYEVVERDILDNDLNPNEQPQKEDLTAELADLEAMVLSSDLTPEIKAKTLAGLPKYDKKTRDNLFGKLEARKNK